MIYLLNVGWALLVPWPISPRLGGAYVYCSSLHFSCPSCQPPYYGSGPQMPLWTDSHASSFLQRLPLPFFTRELSARWWEGQRGSRAVWLTLHGLGLDQSSQPLALSYLLIGSSCSDLVTLHPLRSLLSSSMTQACKLHRNRGLLVPWMAFCPSWTGAIWQLHLLPKR